MFKNLLKRSGANTPSPKSTGENTRNDVQAVGVPNLEVFQTHWRQAMGVIRKHAGDNGTRLVIMYFVKPSCMIAQILT